MTYLICIDVGVKNLGLCIINLPEKKICEWQRVSLYETSKYLPSNNVEYCRRFISAYSNYFSNASAVVIEKQIRCNMRIIESVIHALFYEVTIILHAKLVKMHYNLCMRNYRLNKQAAVEFVQHHMDNETDFATTFRLHDHKPAWLRESKKDDLADSMLLAMYYCDTYSNNSSSSENAIQG